MNKLIALCLLAGLLAGCVSSPKPVGTVKPSMVVLTADQAEARGIHLRPAIAPEPPPPGFDAMDTRAVLAPPEVRVYTMGRYQDRADPDLMHETHAVYRRETTPNWVLQAPSAQQVLIGPRVTDGRQELRPMLSKELDQWVTESRHRAEEDRKAITMLFQGLEAQQKQLGAMMQVLDRQQKLAESKPSEAPPPAPPPPRQDTEAR